MAPRDTARFLGVISEVRLRIIISVFADDLNGALIGADGSVAADTVENQLAHVIAQNIDIPGHRQRQMGDVINDADREIVQSFFALFEIFKHGENLSGIRVLAGKSVTAADDHGSVFFSVERRFHIQIQRLSGSTLFLGSVKNGNPFDRRGNRFEKVFDRERTIKVDVDHADLLVFLFVQIIDNFFDSVANRTHRDDDVGCVRRSVVIEEFIDPARGLRNFIHVVLDDFGNIGVELVLGFPGLEVNVVVLRRTPGDRTVGAKGPVPEAFDRFPVNQVLHYFFVQNFNFLDLMAGSETVKEMQEGNAGLDCREMGNPGQIHDFLN